MKKTIRTMLSLLLSLIMVFQLAGSLSWADDVDVTITGNEALVYELRLADPDSPGSSTPVSAEEETEKLGGKICAVSLSRKDSGGDDSVPLSRSVGGAVLGDLLKKDLIVTPPEGFYVARAYLRGDEVETQSLKSLPFRADAYTTQLVLGAGAVGKDNGESFDKGFLTTGSTVDPQVYTLVLILSPAKTSVTVTEALEKDAYGTNTDLSVGDSFTASAAPENTESHLFAGWQLSYPNGGTLMLNPGESFKPYADCRVEAAWTEIITVTANAPVDSGEGLAPNGWTYSGKLAEGDSIDSVSLNLAEQEDGTVAVPSDAVIMHSGKNVTDRYELRYVSSDPVKKDDTTPPEDDPTPPTDEPAPPAPEPVKLTITAKEPVSNDGGKTYVHDGAVLSSGALNDGDAFAAISIDVKQNEDGTFVAVPRDAVIKNGDMDNTANYEITYLPSQPVTPPAPEPVKLTITAKEPVFNESSKTYVHNGAVLSSGALNDGDAFTAIGVDVKQNEDGSYVAVPRDAVIKNGDTDNTANYEITYLPSQPVKPDAEKIAITIRSKDRTAEYSGKPITADSYELVSGALAEGHSIEVSYAGGSTNVTASPVPSTIEKVVIKDALGLDVTESLYSVTIDNDNAGKVTVTKKSITVTAITGTVETDGTKVIYAKDCKTKDGSFNKGHKVEGLLEGHELRGDFVKGYGSETFTTSIDLNELRIVDAANGGMDVTANYDIKTVDGKMTIKVTGQTGVPVAITVSDQSWTYDGAAHKPDQTKYNISGLLDGDVATVSLQVKQGESQFAEATNAGTYTIVAVVSIRDKDGVAVPDNKYSINAGTGTLTVKKLDITLEAVSDSKPYDGKALVNDKVKAPALANGHKYQGVKLNVYDAKGNLIRNGVKEVGTYTKKITEVHIVDAKGVDVTDNYNITKVDGKLTITPSDKNDSTKPKTGDSQNTGLYIALIAASVLLLAVIGAYVIIQNRRRAKPVPDPDGDDFDPRGSRDDWQPPQPPMGGSPMNPPAGGWNEPGQSWDPAPEEKPFRWDDASTLGTTNPPQAPEATADKPFRWDEEPTAGTENPTQVLDPVEEEAPYIGRHSRPVQTPGSASPDKDAYPPKH